MILGTGPVGFDRMTPEEQYEAAVYGRRNDCAGAAV